MRVQIYQEELGEGVELIEQLVSDMMLTLREATGKIVA